MINIYNFSKGFGTHPVTYIYILDTLPDIGVGFCFVVDNIFYIIYSFIFDLDDLTLNAEYERLYFSHSIIGIFGLLFIWKYLKESKGKSLKDIWKENYEIEKFEDLIKEVEYD